MIYGFQNMNNREHMTKIETFHQHTYNLYPYKSHLSKFL